MHSQALKDAGEKAANYEKEQQGKKFAFESQFGTGDIGQYTSNYLQAHHLEPTPENKLKAHAAFTEETKTAPGVARMEVLAGTKEFLVVDPKAPGGVRYANANEINKTNAGGAPLGGGPQFNPTVQSNLAAGKEATKGVPVIQTALHHLDQLDKATDALKSGDVKAINAIANAYKTQIGDTPLATYRGVQQIIKGDILAASSAVGAKNEKEEAAVDAITSPNNPPEAIKASVQSVRGLMKDRLKAKEDTLKSATSGGNIFTPQTGGGTIRARDPQGKLHEAPAGTPLPDGWKAE